jgi:glycerate-2-kinase
VTNRIVGGSRSAIETVRRKALQRGLEATILSTEVRGEAREMGRWLAEKAKRTRRLEGRPAGAGTPICLIAGGETTVTVKGQGLGGRNMELALAFALEIEGEEGITLLSAGTDGSDGPTDAAGAIVDGHTIARGRAAGLDPGAYLADNDSYHFFKKAGGLFVTGPTGTNVMDVQLVLVD